MIPSSSDLEWAYYELSKLGARAVGSPMPAPCSPDSKEELLVICVEYSRHDPRLFSILVEYLFFHWKEFNPYQLRKFIKTTPTPQSWGVIGEFIASFDKECSYFFEYLMHDIKAVSTQLYFINFHPPASHGMQRTLLEPLEEFFCWGFLARERPIIHAEQRLNLGHWGSYSRSHILKRLVSEKKEISISDYLSALDSTISRQQALLDLKSCQLISSHGKGRGSNWMRKK